MLKFNKGKNKGPKGPDYSQIDSLQKAELLHQRGILSKVLLVPAALGGEDVPENVLYVPKSAAEQKAGIDTKIVTELIHIGKVKRYRAIPIYEGKSFVPNAIEIQASEPTNFIATIAIWGKALED